MFLLVPAYPGCPGSKAVKRSLLLLNIYHIMATISLIWTKSGKVMHIEISFDTFYTDWHECGRWLPCMEFADKILIFAVCVSVCIIYSTFREQGYVAKEITLSYPDKKLELQQLKTICHQSMRRVQHDASCR